MRMPMKARLSFVRYTALTTAFLLAACGRDLTAPQATIAAPETAALAQSGSGGDNYSVSFDPTQDQVFTFGSHRLVIPANSVCELKGMRYGVEHWDTPCPTETRSVKLMVKVTNATGNNPGIDFLPAMRFNPANTVELSMYAPNLTNEVKPWSMYYCNDAGNCIEEAGRDASLKTSVDYATKTLTRRVKHFSGYVIAERQEDASR